MSKFDVPVSVVSYSAIQHIKSGVYVLANDYMNGIYKVGLINRESGNISNRIKEQTNSCQWVIPGAVRCVIFVDTEHPDLLENKMHLDPDMSKFRISEKRELFKMNINDIYKELFNHSKGIASHIYIIEEEADKFGLEYNISKKSTTDKISWVELVSGIYKHSNGFIVYYDAVTNRWRTENTEWESLKQFAQKTGCTLRSLNYSYTSHRKDFISALTFISTL
mgnify:CR=1 FL=1